MDKEIAKLALAIPDKYKISKEYNKPLLVDTFKDLLVEDTYTSTKRGFSLPVFNWAQEYILNGETKKFNDLTKRFQLPSIQKILEYASLGKNKIMTYQWLILIKWMEKHQQVLAG